MQRPRFIDFRASLGPNLLGLCATDSTTLMGYVNEATERLINDPLSPDEGWWGSWVRMAFNVSRGDPNIYTPQGIARIILLDVCKHPVRINNSFYEFLEFGKGYQPSGCSNVNGGTSHIGCSPLMAYERETVVTFTPLLGTPQIIRAYASDPTDVGRIALVQGADANGQTIRFLDGLSNATGLGEKISLNSPFVDTLNHFSTITGIQKQKSFGEVQFFQVDPATGVETPLLVMQPGETTALYRKYYVNGLPAACCNGTVPQGTNNLQVLAMCKLDYQPVSCDSDYLGILSVPALIDECMSLRYGGMDTPGAQQLSAAKHKSALSLLFGQLDHYLGKERPAIQRHLFGSNRMRLQPI
jgi:hypothetical protein